jgi:hypothetical protein
MENNNYNVEEEEVPVVTLTDEETGEDIDFEVLAETTIDDRRFVALIPVEEEANEYVILEVKEDGDDILFETVEDEAVAEKVEDFFNDLFFSEMDYDN